MISIFLKASYPPHRIWISMNRLSYMVIKESYFSFIIRCFLDACSNNLFIRLCSPVEFIPGYGTDGSIRHTFKSFPLKTELMKYFFPAKVYQYISYVKDYIFYHHNLPLFLTINDIISSRSVRNHGNRISNLFFNEFYIFTAVFRKVFVFLNSTDICLPARKFL